MASVHAEAADPHKAVQGWIQDYWMLRLLDPRGLPLNDAGGPYDPAVGGRKDQARRTAFKNFAKRLAVLGWAIVWRPFEDGSAIVTAIPAQDWVDTLEVEVVSIGGWLGVALGLPPRLAQALHEESIADIEFHFHSGRELLSSPARKVPAYRSYTPLDPEVLQFIEHMLEQQQSDDIDLDELRATALAAAA